MIVDGMRPSRTARHAGILLVLLLCLSACSATSAKCRNNSCTVAVKTTETASVEILDHQMEFRDLAAGSVTVVYAGQPYYIPVGQTAGVGSLTVTVTSAEPGRAQLVIAADQHSGADTARGHR
ncbi:hypothetical protein ACFHWS_18675 [Micromonospora sp. LOL_013]|uniref:hypothetical protein n=2 Tax=unclassified Micromonospora TaxID=2617518 RepID=UPI003A871028